MTSYLYIDAHIHVDKYEQQEQEELVKQAAAGGVQRLVAVSMDLASSKATYRLYQQLPELIMPLYGHHPEIALPSAEEETALVEWIRERADTGEVFSIGEIGLPYYNELEAKATASSFDLQPYIAFLERMLLLAKELERPVALHAVYEHADIVCDLLEKYEIRKAHFHWFKGAPGTIERMKRAGYFISITPDVLYEEEIRTIVEHYPIEQLMVETDGPWPFEGPYKGQMTQSAMVADVVKHIAAIKQVPEEEAAAIIYKSTQQFYML